MTPGGYLPQLLVAEHPIKEGEPRRYGIRESYWKRLTALFRSHPVIERVILYGSRAKGTYQPYSDVDITLVGAALDEHQLSQISTEIDDLLLPYFFDTSIYHTLSNPALIASIASTGTVVYERN